MMTVTQAAKALGIGERKMREMIRDGAIPHHQYGSTAKPIFRVAAADVDDFIEASRIEPRAATQLALAATAGRRRRRPQITAGGEG